MITKDTTIGELEQLLRSLPRGARLTMHARSDQTAYKPGQCQVTYEDTSDFKTTARHFDLAAAIEAALASHVAHVLRYAPPLEGDSNG